MNTSLTAKTLGVLLGGAVCVSFAQPILKITSPKDGTIVRPGASLKVRVKASGEPAMRVFIIGGTSMGVSTAMLDAPPYDFTVEVPRKIAPGRYNLTASGSALSGDEAKPDTTTVDVERAESPVSLSVEPASSLRLYVDEEVYVDVVGTFPDGTTISIQDSTLTKLSSRAPRIASVRRDGLVKRLAPGSTSILISNGKARVEVPVFVSAQ